MKTHSLFSHTTIVLESEDDLFPGISSSAFGNKKMSADPNSFTELSDKQTELTDHQNVYHDRLNKVREHLRNNDAFTHVAPGKQPASGDVMYSSLDWMSKYRHAHSILTNYAISKSSPLFKNAEQYIREYDSIQIRITYFYEQLAIVDQKIKKLKRRIRGRKK